MDISSEREADSNGTSGMDSTFTAVSGVIKVEVKKEIKEVKTEVDEEIVTESVHTEVAEVMPEIVEGEVREVKIEIEEEIGKVKKEIKEEVNDETYELFAIQDPLTIDNGAANLNYDLSEVKMEADEEIEEIKDEIEEENENEMDEENEDDIEEVIASMTPQCVLCDKHPKTVYGYTSHLQKHHHSTLKASEIYLLCQCGLKVTSNNIHPAHTQNCDGHRFILHKLDKTTTPQCILCEAHPSTVIGYAAHLYKNHNYSMIANGIYLLCSCGKEMRSHFGHSKECDGKEFTIHKENEKVHSTPQCVLCESYPSTALAYATHLAIHHKSTLLANGICLLCACGREFRNRNDYANHNKECGGRQFSMLKLEKKSTPQCVLCDAYPVSAAEYAIHLHLDHNSTLTENGIYLVCSCGHEVHMLCTPQHFKKCDGKEFALHKYDDKAPSTPQCTMCEAHPSTIYGYDQHIRKFHKSTMKANGIYLLCSCGSEVHADTSNYIHCKSGCAGLQFTVHQLSVKSPRCILCKHSPKTANAYAKHLFKAHKTTLKSSGLYLICSCGREVRCALRDCSHGRKCESQQFTLRKMEENNQ